MEKEFEKVAEVITLLDGICLSYYGKFKKDVLKFFEWKFAPLTDGTTSTEIILIYPKSLNNPITAEQIEPYKIDV